MYVFLPFAFGGNPAAESGPRAIQQFLGLQSNDFICIEQTSDESAIQYLERVYNEISGILEKRQKVVVFGGNHLSILPLYRYYYEHKSRIITLDAHCDCYVGGDLNHANFMNLLQSECEVEHVVLGARDKMKKENQCNHIQIKTFDRYLETMMKEGTPGIDFLDIDVDVIDPEIFSWCGSPCEAGITVENLKDFVKKYKELGGNVMAISEYIPNWDLQQQGLHIIQSILAEFI